MNKKTSRGTKLPSPEIITANQKVHTQIATKYNQSEPHFRPENQEKVKQRLSDAKKLAPSNKRMLDVGCGTGFLINLAHDLFERIDGIDATQAMLDCVDLSPGNVHLHQGIAEDLPFEDQTFDVVTAYSFIDHLEDYRLMISEAARVLKPQGCLYVDLIPNRLFWNEIFELSESDNSVFDPIVNREINELVRHEEKLKEQYGIDPSDWKLTEPAKSDGNGYDPKKLEAEISNLGFDCKVEFEWYLGQAQTIHGISKEAAKVVDQHLHRLLPITGSLFKYLVVTGMKK